MRETQEKLKKIISEYIDYMPEDILMDMDIKFDIGLDSFSLISLVCAIEDEFSVDIPESICSNFKTLNDIADFVYMEKINHVVV